MANSHTLEPPDVLEVSGSAHASDAMLIDVEQFGELEITIARPTGFALSRLLRALEALGADIIANELAAEEDRDTVRASLRLQIDSAHTSLLKIKFKFVISHDVAPRLKKSEGGSGSLKSHLAAALIALLVNEGYAELKKQVTVPPPGACDPAIVETAGRTLQDGAREGQEISLTTNLPAGEPLEVRIVVPTLGLPPDRRRRSE